MKRIIFQFWRNQSLIMKHPVGNWVLYLTKLLFWIGNIKIKFIFFGLKRRIQFCLLDREKISNNKRKYYLVKLKLSNYQFIRVENQVCSFKNHFDEKCKSECTINKISTQICFWYQFNRPAFFSEKLNDTNRLSEEEISMKINNFTINIYDCTSKKNRKVNCKWGFSYSVPLNCYRLHLGVITPEAWASVFYIIETHR